MPLNQNGSNKKSFAQVAAASLPREESASNAAIQEPKNIDHLSRILKDSSLEDGPADTKSVTSRTTLALDEKESLRPDDSASMQAAPEEDSFSPAGSVLAGSSDPDIRAFRDQLYEIDRTGSKAAELPSLVKLDTEQRNGGIIFTTPPAASPFPTASRDLAIPPDEKLLEALASPKDRLFVLKIEQDMIDFVKDSKEEFLQLPQTNSFYRMLSHKLADYYLLGHVIDESMTSVRVFRTPNARLPPPLIGLDSAAEGMTPPPSAPTRKIMRRGAVLESPSLSDGEDKDAPNKAQSALTREERENRYKEARARIFKGFNEEDSSSQADKGVSRSSSISAGKKKHPKDDGFEARSAFSQYGGQAFGPSGLPKSPQTYHAPMPYQYPSNGYALDPWNGSSQWYGQDMYMASQSTPKQAHLAMNWPQPGYDGYQMVPAYPPFYPPMHYPAYSPNQPQFNPRTQAFVPAYQNPVPQPIWNQNNFRRSKPPKQTSISKWGAPSTLPPKPPPPATSLSFQVPKNSESQQPLPPHPFSHG